VKEEVLQLFTDHRQLAIFISVALSILIAIVGVLPSVIITAANILFFGFWEGLFISFLGEALGAVVSFLLYRKGFKKKASTQLQKFPRLQKLVLTEGSKAFGLIFSLRLLPFVPSGLITFASAIGRVSLFIFVMASSLGKIPALLLEGYSVNQVGQFNWQGKIILAVAALFLFMVILKQINSRNRK
jgi:uncharacterized membrane protein YdjX (TVP38/TMEM64 family)